jgi:hypothetical protein
LVICPAYLLVISMEALSDCTSQMGWNSSTTSPSCRRQLAMADEGTMGRNLDDLLKDK